MVSYYDSPFGVAVYLGTGKAAGTLQTAAGVAIAARPSGGFAVRRSVTRRSLRFGGAIAAPATNPRPNRFR